MTKKQMKIVLQMVSGYGGEFKTWRLPEAKADAYTDIDYYVEMAQLAEKGKLHALFMADTPALVNDLTYDTPMHSMDPLIFMTSVARATKHIGLVGTFSTTFNEPYNLARHLKTLDVISHGRVGWNTVTTSTAATAENFGTHLMSSRDRYGRAHEVIEAVQGLWGSWGEGAYLHDKESGQFADMSKISPIHYNGEYIKTAGPLPIPPSEQGQPPIFQAGPSPEGIRLAGRFASGVYANPFTIEEARDYRNILRESAVAHGRSADDINIFTGFMVTIADTKEEAIARRRQVMNFDPQETKQRLNYLSAMVGINLNSLDIEKPLPQEVRSMLQPHWQDPRSPRAVQLLQEGYSPLDTLAMGVINYHPVVVGTATDVADFLQEWFEAGATDGFSIVPDLSHDGVRAFVEQVVPILQERGIFHEDYEGNTLRENLGVSYQYGVRDEK
ncbi:MULTISPECIES: NtaA/DmoA family FMN-dependent monooxygenase [unclassified Facklamia]|uniref:NtaA/DmoA family FMN-dependent monooxygenase n=1 Tax=Aerococcaceae TaxID=186827 RepID=UPI0013B7E85A|nr:MULTISPECIES: NtaA/DmoA family FMN-dependent monooxygenase [unclassified Facklamia]NEW64662.1 NtaA/DmoA family FMN-dependent monooxygenase [Facklamia sp. 252]NEW67987.1 NtaA/DmoA family FMN-dependent monooxygenase [Facklamia sp. 253]QQD65073.1 NtaA/DmoA family FMN-dependent monooxygenase [Aerococcaceae bacterium zg-252]